jgi:uncharacterized membrane protein YjjB (DUF3815 family)
MKLQRGRANGLRTLLPWVGAAVSIWIFTEASRVELVWAGVSLAVGAVLVFLTGRARNPLLAAAASSTRPADDP